MRGGPLETQLKTSPCAPAITAVARSATHRSRVWLRTAAVVVAIGAAAPVLAQSEPPEDAHRPYESLALSPVIRLTDVGWDNNVRRVDKAAGPTEDFTTTFAPALQAWLRLPAVKFNGQSEVDFLYFQRVSEYRSVDADTSGRVDMLLGRFTPYVGGGYVNARHRRDFEIDAPVRRVESSLEAGIDLRLTGKTSIGLTTRRSHVDYKGDTVYLDTDLSRALGTTTTAAGVRMRYAVTPFTTVGADIEHYQNRFPMAPERDASGVRVVSVVEFQPRAQVNGSAAIGVTKRTFADRQFPQFQGAIARGDLGYTLFERTRFGLHFERDLSYSYRPDERDYLQSGVELSVNHRLAAEWDLRGTVGRYSLNYGLGDSSGLRTAAGVPPEEKVVSYGVDVGYRVGSTRIGFQVNRQARTSDFTGIRGYEQTRVASSLTYGF